MLTTSYHLAERSHSVCRGTLWLQKQVKQTNNINALSRSLFGSSDNKTSCEYCVLTGVHMRCYESLAAWERGDAMQSSLRLVGASSSTNEPLTVFRLVTDQGTHVHCQAPSTQCQSVWLTALTTGLELALIMDEEQSASSSSSSLSSLSMPTLIRPQPQKCTKKTKRNQRLSLSKHCFSCGAVEGGPKYLVGHACPLNHYGKETKVDVCSDCFVAQGLLEHVEFVKDCLASSQQERQALLKARDICQRVVVVVVDSVDVPPPAEVAATTTKVVVVEAAAASSSLSTVSEQALLESPLPLADGELLSDGSWSNVSSANHSSSTSSDNDNNSSESTSSLPPPPSELAACWQTVEHTPATKALMELLTDPTSEFNAIARTSPCLTVLAAQVVQGQIGAQDFQDELDEMIGQRESGGIAALKKQAFEMAGDMGTAMKMLLDNAIPKQPESHNTEVLTGILNFFLGLCEDGELACVAFFWQQLCHIHLRMLPPANGADLARIELMEDFLMTVAARYSIHLALELVWSHTADLEDSLSLNPATVCPPACRRRRFAVMRFLCELESLLFDFDDGFGGGSVTLGKMLAPAGDQMDRMKQCVKKIQQLRKSSQYQLTLSYRLDKLSGSSHDKPPEEAVQEKLRIARNADYFSSQLNFSKRICDVAEKLRFLEVEARSDALTEELDLLNSSGAMGGDPLNVAQENLIRVVRVPSTEGHVFRSKERTPVLLLMEIVDEKAYDSVQDEKSDIVESSDGESSYVERAPPLQDPANGSILFAESSDLEPVDCAVEPGSSDVLEQASPSNHQDVQSVKSNDVLEGSFHCAEPIERSPKPAALKRFEGADLSDAPPTPKSDVEDLLNTVMVKQLQVVNSASAELQLPKLASSMEDDGATDAVEEYHGMHDKGTGSSAENTDSSASKTLTEKRSMKNLSRSRSSERIHTLAPTGDVRREVLNAIMIRGVEGNTIAAGAVDSVQRSLQELERQRATELLLGDPSGDDTEEELESTRQKLVSLGITATIPTDQMEEGRSEEDEVMESIRLLLIQHRVAQGKLSPADAAKVLQHTSISRAASDSRLSERVAKGLPLDHSECPTVDAGDIDRRLVGCGPLPPAVLQALTLWKGEMVSNAELLELVKKDILFVKHSVLYDAENAERLVEDSDFWGRFAFGERWAEKKARISSASPVGMYPGWDMQGVIVKSNDDLRQEQFIMQLIELSKEAFELAGLELWLSPYRIIATGRSTGIIEMVRNAMSFDALKKRPGYGKGGLREHLNRMCEFTADPGKALTSAQRNFVRSLAAYSLISYFFQIKDRHNGNLLLDTAGHVIHIDFGFVFGKAPGGNFSLEMSTPFKLTEEMLDVMGGLKSPLFSEFVTLFCCGFLALQSYSGTFFTVVEIMCAGSTFKCFEGRTSEEIIGSMRERICPELSKEETVAFALDLISQAATSYGTRQYDLFQYMSQGIAA